MIGRTNVGGGGGALSEAFAVIAVTYPASSTCTCTNGAKTLKAKDTSGSYLFMIPYAGTWTVRCTDGAESAETSVGITSLYQMESVTLDYGFYLYKNGNTYDAITGGWAVGEGTGSADFGQDFITLTSQASKVRIHVATNSKVSFDGFNTLHALVEVMHFERTSASDPVLRLGYSSSRTANLGQATTKAQQTITETGLIELTYDISNIAESYFAIFGIGYPEATVNVLSVWLS